MIYDFRLDKAAISGSGAALGGGYGRYAPEVVGKAIGDGRVPEFIFEATSALGSEFFTGFANKNIDNNAGKEKKGCDKLKDYIKVWVYSCLYCIFLCFFLGIVGTLLFYVTKEQVITSWEDVERAIVYGVIAGTSITLYLLVTDFLKK